jgi:parallel beta-helix repeat protein
MVVQRDSIVLDGAGYALFGSGLGAGLSLYYMFNVTVVGLKVSGFSIGIDLGGAANCTIVECQVFSNVNHGILLANSAYNHVLGNGISRNGGDGIRVEANSTLNEIGFNGLTNNTLAGISLSTSTDTTIRDNSLFVNGVGITTQTADGSSLFGNVVEQCSGGGIRLSETQDSVLTGNTIVENGWNGIYCTNSPNNTLFHNNLINNFNPISLVNSTSNWDRGYPLGGNYWSDHVGEDLYRGPDQNETGYDGISDSPYYYEDNPLDRYPLMGPFGATTSTGDNVTVFALDTLGLVFASVVEAGETTAFPLDAGYPAPPDHVMLQRYDVRTTATASGDILLRIIYGDSGESLLPGETAPTLLLINGLQGDVDYDFDVDIYDVVYLTGGYGTHAGDPDFRPGADLDRDGDVDIFDIVIATSNYGTTIPEEARYEDITAHVDTIHQVIFGVAPHLSIFGVTRPS